MQFKFIIFTLDIKSYDVSNVEKYLMRVLYKDDVECVDVVSTLKVFKNPNDAGIVILSKRIQSCFFNSCSKCILKRFFHGRFIIRGRFSPIEIFIVLYIITWTCIIW